MMDIDTSAELMSIRVAGVFAKAHQVRQVEPTADEWAFLRGLRDMRLREMGEWAARLEIDIDFAPMDLRAPPSADADGGSA
jgi:hypothetical protein